MSNTTLTDREKALQWWDDLPVEYKREKYSSIKKGYGGYKTILPSEIESIWRKEKFPTASSVESGELKCTPGEWELHLGRHKEGASIFGWGIRVKGKAAHLALQGVYEANNAIGLGLNGEPIDILFTPEEAEANAHLIAASKDLYNMLRKWEQWFNDPNTDWSIANGIYLETVAALKKANPQ